MLLQASNSRQLFLQKGWDIGMAVNAERKIFIPHFIILSVQTKISKGYGMLVSIISSMLSACSTHFNGQAK